MTRPELLEVISQRATKAHTAALDKVERPFATEPGEFEGPLNPDDPFEHDEGTEPVKPPRSVQRLRGGARPPARQTRAFSK